MVEARERHRKANREAMRRRYQDSEYREHRKQAAREAYRRKHPVVIKQVAPVRPESAKTPGSPPERPIVHGTYGRYVRGCRCSECRAANTEAQRKRRARIRSTAT